MAKQQESYSSANLQALVPFGEQQQQQNASGSSGAGFGGDGGGGGKKYQSHTTLLGNALNFDKMTDPRQLCAYSGFGSQHIGFGNVVDHVGGKSNLFGRNTVGYKAAGELGYTCLGKSSLDRSGSDLMRGNDCSWSIFIVGFPAGNSTNTTSVFGRNVCGFSMTLDGTNLRIDLAHPGSFGAPSVNNVFVKYPADSGGPFADGGCASGTSHHTHPTRFFGLPYSPVAATQDGPTRGQVPLTEDFQTHTEPEKDSLSRTVHYHSISSSKPFRNLSFEVCIDM